MTAEFRLDVLPHDKSEIYTHLFSSDSTDDVIAAVNWIVGYLPTEMQRAQARVGIMLSLRHDEEPAK